MTIRIAPLPTEAPPIPDAGLGALITDRGNLPLDSVDVRAAITGLTAGLEVTQGFRNPFDIPLEATYVFPLPDRAAVTGLRMEAADRVIEGTLKERGQAREDYDTAIAAGQRAAIAEEERPDVFTMRVGNILPGERVTVTLTLNQPLPYEDDAATFRFPLVVAPRYIPGHPMPETPAGDGVAPDTDAVPDASRISPPVLLPGFPNPVRLSLAVEIDPAGLPLTEVRSSLHVVSTETEGRTTVRVEPGERLNRDFILRLGFAEAQSEAASLALTPDGTFTLTVLPPAEVARPRPRDVVLLLDRSGSMDGWKMVAARRAAARIVDTLTEADRFAVLSFDHTVERPRELGSGLSTATDRNRFRAVEHLAGLTARGGTEMLSPLLEGMGLLADSGRDRVLVLITDGQVGNEDHILSRIEPQLAAGGRAVRIHAVGIDRAVNAGFLGRLAAVGQGRFELVESEDRLDEAMEHIHHRIGAPLVTGLSLDWSGLDVVPDTVTPRRLGALFPGVPLVISGRHRGAREDSSATVRGTTALGERWERRAATSMTRDGAATSVWARGHLRDLEDRYAIGGPEDLERRIVETSLRFGVLCRFTAFVAVDTRVATEGEPTHKVIQPVEQPDGWASRSAVTFQAAATALPVSASPPGAPSAHLPMAPPPQPGDGAASAGFSAAGGAARLTRGSLRAPRADSDTSPSTYERLLAGAREELDRLTALTGAPPLERWQHLSDLRTRLEALVRQLQDAGLPAERLIAMADELRVADDPAQQSRLEELWTLVVRELTAFTEAEDSQAGTAPRRAFWKKRP